MEEGITSLAYHGLRGSNVSEIILPQSLTKLDERVLSEFHKLKEITIPDKVKALPKETLTSCTSLTKIVFPNKLELIGDKCFQNCKLITKLVLPDTVTYIGKNAFKGCKELSTITIPKKLKTYKADLTKKPKLTKVINHSSKTIPLDDCNGAKTWKVNGKKVKSVPPGKTATSKVARYKIVYYYSGGKAQGKCPKYYYYGKAPKLPIVKKKGYTFLGWFDVKDYGDVHKEFPSKQEADVHMTAILVKLTIKRIAKNKVKITLKDNIRWGKLAANKIDINAGYIYPKTKHEEYLIRVKSTDVNGKDKTYRKYLFRKNMTKTCTVALDKEQYITLSFNWFYGQLDGDYHPDEDPTVYVGEKKFKIPAYKNK